MTEISVKITKYANRKYWSMYYDDPMSGERKWKSTKSTGEKDARKAAGKWEAELREGRYKPRSTVTWAEFREAVLFDHLRDAPTTTVKSYATAMNAVERHCKIVRLAELTSQRIRFVAEKLRDVDKLTPATVGSYLRQLKACLNWAAKPSVALLSVAPIIEMPEGASGKAKGRPITLEEFERMLAKVEYVLSEPRLFHKQKDGPKLTGKAADERRERLAKHAATDAAEWTRLLWGMWLSGLRLGEVLALTWDDEKTPRVDLSGDYPMLRIPAGCQKGRRDTVTPILPGFTSCCFKRPRIGGAAQCFPPRLAASGSMRTT